MTIFITSDTHYDHKNILEFEDRPFATLDEMKQGMIDAWNGVVSKADTVYHLGDFSFGKASDWIDVLNQLRGNIILIKGNHDKSKVVKRVISEGYLQGYHELGTIIKTDGMTLNLSHYPMLVGTRLHNYSVHGHIHGYDTGYLNNLNVGVDSTFAKAIGQPFGTPIPLELVVQHFNETYPKIEEEFKKQRGL